MRNLFFFECSCLKTSISASMLQKVVGQTGIEEEEVEEEVSMVCYFLNHRLCFL